MSVACKIFDPQELDWGRQARIVNPQRLILKEELRMKKVLSLVLAFAMILGSFGFVFASQFPDVEDGQYYSEPVNVLSGLGVIGGFPDGTFKPEKEVTRAEMATMVVNALGMTVTGQSDTKYSDVPKSHWASGFINYATSVGFVAGYPNGTFKPDDPVTYDQALTMIVAAEGYKAESLPGNWPGNFVNKAKSLGMLDICATTGTANAPREDIACFLYKALTNKIGYTDKDGEFHANLDAKGNATDTMIARLGGTPYLPDAQGNPSPFVVDGTQSSDISLDNYFGAYITAYASKTDNTKIIAVAEVLSEFIDGKVNTGKTAIGDYKITTGTKQLTPGFVYFENGEISTAKTTYTATTGKTMTFAVKLDGAKIAEVYSAQEWTAAGTFRAGEDIQEELADDQKLDGTYTFVLDDDDEIDESEFIMVGKDKLADLAEDDIVTVYLDKITTGDVAKIEVSTEKVEGKITKIDNTGKKYTVAGTTYDVAADAKAAATGLQPDAEGTFFLNYAGEVFDFEETSDTTKNFAIVLATGQDASRYKGGETPFIKMFLADGTVGEFAAESKIDFNGASTTIAYGAGNVWTTPALTAGDVVEYEIDSDNVIVGLKTLATTYTGATKFDNNGIFNGTAVKSDTVIFSFTGATGEEAESKYYSVLTLDDVKGNNVATVIGGDNKGDFTAIKVTGVEESSKVYAIFASKDGKNADGNIWTVLYDGEVKEMTLKTALAPTTYATGSAADLYTLTFEGEVVKAITTASAIAADFDGAPTAKLDVNGNTFKLGTKTYSLDEEVKIYVYDESDEEWSKLTKLGNVKYNYMYLLDTNTTKDGMIDIILVFKD